MGYYNTRTNFFVDCYGNDVKQSQKIDIFLNLLYESGVYNMIETSMKKDLGTDKGGRPPYNPYNLFGLIIYNFAFGTGTLRDIEERCKYDLRCIYIMQNEFPSHMTICSFINKYIIPNEEKIFSLITKAIFNKCSLNMDKMFIDGSKFEANANKYKFVWKPTKFHANLGIKVRSLLAKYDLQRGLPNDSIIESKIVAKKIIELNEFFKRNNIDLSLKVNREHSKNYKLLLEILEKSLEYEEKERICGPNRNSYYKTDHDATAMCLKEDYYSGLGSNMHAAYNTQIAVIHGLITTYLVTQSRTDLCDFTPLLDRHYSFYESYPTAICADAGYGSYENYKYLDDNNIKNYVKYFTWEGNVSGNNPSQYRLNSDDTIECLNGHTGYKEDETKIKRHHKKANSTFYRIDGCQNCNFMYYCKRYMKDKTENFKIFEVALDTQKYIQQAEENLLSIEGIEMRVNRSTQVEGAFGVIKQNFQYDRFRRRSITKVSTEFMLVCLGYNIRKLFKFFDGKLKFDYWIAPDNIKAETFKKPSAKRLSKKSIIH